MLTRFQDLFYRPFPAHLPIWAHAVIWLLYLMLALYMNYLHGVDFLAGYPSIYILAQAAMFYANFNYLISILLAQRKFALFVALNLLLAAGLVTIFIPAYHGLRDWAAGAVADPFPLPYGEQFVLRFCELLLVMLLACLARFAVDWFAFRQKTRDMENVQLRTELAFLRSQLNPHFLFNTLNALYALSIRQSPDTSDGIMQLSQLMRYALYETNDERIDLSKEIEMAGHFIELQKLRLPLDFPIDFEIRGEINGITIAPFLLMPLIENMFKHGTEFASISLKAAENSLTLITVNGIRKPTRDEPGGIGLTNLRRRLSHLYPGKHFLVVESDAGRFQTTLTLILN